MGNRMNGVLRRTCGPKREDGTGGWRKVHKEELHSLCNSPYIVRMIKWIRWAGHVVHMR
jgi:hypothetical protein